MTRSASLRKRLNAFTAELAGLEEGHASALHRARVATRRLRELVPVLGLDHDDSRKLERRLRKTTKRLGVVRELDVMRLLVKELRRGRHYSPAALDIVAAAVAKERSASTRRIKHKLTDAKLRRLARRLQDILELLEADDASAEGRAKESARAWLWALEERLVHRSNELRTAIEAPGPLYRPGELHDVRIALKKLRYGVELAQEAGLGGALADLTTLKDMQEALGRLHDLESLIERARDAQASTDPPNLATWGELGSILCDLEDECRLLHARYMSHRGKLLGVCDRAAGRRPALAGTRLAAS